MPAAPPRRVVSLVPSTTETVCAFGFADRLVGCTRYCVEPAAPLAAVQRIGGTKNPARDAIAALRPDLVLGNAEENRPEDLEWLAARVPTLVQTPRTVPAATHALRELAERLGAPSAAEPFVRRIDAEVAALAADPPTAPVRVYYAIWRKPWMTVSGDTFVHDVLQRVGCVNVAGADAARYPELSQIGRASCRERV